MVTIKDIAAKAGVAKSTVSNALTGKKYVSPEIKDKILKICDELDYSPNFFASTLSSKTRTNLIGLFLEGTTSNRYKRFYSPLIESCVTTAGEYKMNIIIYSGLDQDDILSKIRQGGALIDGAIILSPTIDDTRIKGLNNKIPTVVIGRPGKSKEIPYVDVDNKGLTYYIAKKMCEAGYNRVCLINSDENLMISKERDQGLLKCFEKNEGSSIIFHSKDSSFIDAYNFSNSALNKGFNAYILCSGTAATGLYEACNERHIEIGKDIVVFSLGYSQETTYEFNPSLSYATQDYYRFGTLATEKVINMLNNKPFEKSEIIESEIHSHRSFRIKK